jgi:hypothetical protein
MDATREKVEHPHVPRQIYLIKHSLNPECHWGLFLPYSPVGNHEKGSEAHVVSDKELSQRDRWMESDCPRPTDYSIVFEEFDKARYEQEYLKRHDNPERKPRQYAFEPIAEAVCTHEQLKRVSNEVHKGGTFNYAFNNCQHFCINVIERLHKLYAKSVTKKSVKNISAMQESYPRVTTSSRQKVVVKESPQAKGSGREEDESTAPEKEHGIRKLFNGFSKPRLSRGSRPATPQDGSSGDRRSGSLEESE